MVDDAAHRQVCDALHRAIIGRDKLLAAAQAARDELSQYHRWIEESGCQPYVDADGRISKLLNAAIASVEGVRPEPDRGIPPTDFSALPEESALAVMGDASRQRSFRERAAIRAAEAEGEKQ